MFTWKQSPGVSKAFSMTEFLGHTELKFKLKGRLWEPASTEGMYVFLGVWWNTSKRRPCKFWIILSIGTDVPSHTGVLLFEELFHGSGNVLHVDLKCCVGFCTLCFPGGSGKSKAPKSTSDLGPALFYFLLSSCWFWKLEVHFQSGEADNWLLIP